MRISLIHGEDSLKAYTRFRELVDTSKTKGFEIIQISDIHDIVSQSLFEDKTVFILEKPNKVNLNDWKWLAKNSLKYNSNLLIYYDGNAPVTVIRNLGKDAKIEKFDLPKIIFSFLDSFWRGNAKNSLRLLNDLVKDTPVELVFFMLSRHIRDLYWAETSKETMDIPEWRALKLASQAGKFEEGKLKKIINELSEIDVKSKTRDVNLKSLLDELIFKNLQ